MGPHHKYLRRTHTNIDAPHFRGIYSVDKKVFGSICVPPSIYAISHAGTPKTLRSTLQTLHIYTREKSAKLTKINYVIIFESSRRVSPQPLLLQKNTMQFSHHATPYKTRVSIVIRMVCIITTSLPYTDGLAVLIIPLRSAAAAQVVATG